MKTSKILSSIMLLVAISSIYADEQPCGGILEGAMENFDIPNRIVINGNRSLVLYPERMSGDMTLNPIQVRADAVGEKLNFQGSTVIIISTPTTSAISFTWDSETTEDSKGSVTIIADYIQTQDGKLVWSPRRRQEKLWWLINLELSPDDVVEWKTRADLSDCDINQPCTCLSFEAYEISSEGHLTEIARVCGNSTSGSLGYSCNPLVIAASANTTRHGASRVELYWRTGEEQPGTTSTVTSTETTPGPPSGIASHIYFGTAGGGIKAFSLATSTVTRTVVDSAGDFRGIAYDQVNNKIYYGNNSPAQIYRANIDGSGIETLQSNVDFVVVNGLAFDWRTQNLYVASWVGKDRLFLCRTTSGNLMCTSLPNNGEPFEGITLDPLRGRMFIAGARGIFHAQMDGINIARIVSGRAAAGIDIDQDSDRLHWTDFGDDGQRSVASSLRSGSDVQTVVALDSSAYPWGLVTLGGSVYWADNVVPALQCRSTTGEDVVTIYN